ncbi:MAG: TetR family transcriptional regulator [Paenibacillaceae bacterium]|jgi:AcrR family transcriptional regulator|nr:TetR family transcriptional regulator [Paenibacillaceae bacterium]
MCARRVVDQELSRDRILEEARGLFASRGYDTLTMRSIAKALGYSHGALYYHFRDKAELFYALVVEDFNYLLIRQREFLEQAIPVSIEHMKEMMMEFIRFGMEHPHHYEIMFSIRDEDLRRYSRTKQAQCMDMFAMVVREVIKDDPQLESKLYTLPWTLFMSLHGFISYSIHYHQSYEEVQGLAESHVTYLCHGLNTV